MVVSDLCPVYSGRFKISRFEGHKAFILDIQKKYFTPCRIKYFGF